MVGDAGDLPGWVAVPTPLSCFPVDLKFAGEVVGQQAVVQLRQGDQWSADAYRLTVVVLGVVGVGVGVGLVGCLGGCEGGFRLVSR